jgi:SAM-dependent methyltransferase
MSDPIAPVAAEKTFRSYTHEQGAKYAQNRLGYNPNLYKTILDYHTSSGGQLDTILDVGCGPGIAARALAPSFAHAIGIDPSEGMITSARSLGGTSSTTEDVRFEISSAEALGSDLSPPIKDSSVDLITASTAAHWFDMPRFWPQVARVLKPGGTVALWSTNSGRIHTSMPNATVIQAALDEIDERELKPFMEPGNLLTRDLYVDLKLPWMLSPPSVDFDKTTFLRKVWGPEDAEEFFMGGSMTMTLDQMEKIMSTASPVQRWREANPEAVGTDRDVVKLMRAAAEGPLHEAGVEKGKEIIKGSISGVLLMLKRNA